MHPMKVIVFAFTYQLREQFHQGNHVRTIRIATNCNVGNPPPCSSDCKNLTLEFIAAKHPCAHAMSTRPWLTFTQSLTLLHCCPHREEGCDVRRIGPDRGERSGGESSGTCAALSCGK
jgi:hypothetical protein